MTNKYIGVPLKRKEDPRFLKGQAKFVGDMKLPNTLHAVILRSPHAHAYLRHIDTQNALAIPGVIAIFTAQDIDPHIHHPARIPLRPGRNLLRPTKDMMRPLPPEGEPMTGIERFLQQPIAHDKVRYVGEPVAVVIAEDPYKAEDGADAIEVTYEPLPAVVTEIEALRDEVILHEEVGTNICAEAKLSIGDVEEAFAAADYTRKEVFHTHRLTGNPLETRGLMASYDPGKGDLTMWGPTKVPYHNRYVLSELLGMPESKIHFVEPDVGAGFGVRGEFYAEDFLIPFTAIRLGKPVKWIEDRREHLMGSNHSRQQRWEVEVAASRDGAILGIRANVYANLGAYIRSHGIGPVAGAATLLLGPYKIRNYDCTLRGLITNKMGTGTLRAPGRYESTFVRERLLDMIAEDLGLDPVQIRLNNFIQASDMPYNTGVSLTAMQSAEAGSGGKGSVFDSGDYPALFNRAIEDSNYQELKDLDGKLIDGKYHGIGLACYVESTGGGGLGPFEGARIVATRDNCITVYTGLAVLGQGHETTLAQICAEVLDVSIDIITVLHGNTDWLPYGAGTTGSRGAVMGGNAVYLAALELRKKVLSHAGQHLSIPVDDLEFTNGIIYRHGDRATPLLALKDVVELASPLTYETFGEIGLQAMSYFRQDHGASFTYGTHVAHAVVDAETGKVDLADYFVIEDVGRCINPLIVHGQAIGGAVHGIGQTLLEEMVYDPNGQLMTSTFMDYLLPTSTDVPPITAIVSEEAPSPNNPLGVKGAGEGGLVATGGAISNAVVNALQSFDVQVTQLPLSPSNIRSLIKESSRKPAQ
ncbi:xanthine dehydrogenase family protein molybdopterin-binding subunit [Dehalococcoidia bacterium]|nr:xanthine dehydrogenase family protein molybdopterin-binding subunit [Dehalococcoidia bacterium]